MFKQINAQEHVVGRYNVGPKLRENDVDVYDLFHDYVPNPMLLIIDVWPKEPSIPTKAYYVVEEVKENATQKSQKLFVQVPSQICAHKVGEIGMAVLEENVGCVDGECGDSEDKKKRLRGDSYRILGIITHSSEEQIYWWNGILGSPRISSPSYTLLPSWNYF